MKKDNDNNYLTSLISAVVGGIFFAIPYIALNLNIVLSLIIAIVAFGATNLILTDDKTQEVIANTATQVDNKATTSSIISQAKNQNAQIKAIAKEIDDVELDANILEICDTVTKILDTVSRKPEKMSSLTTFFNYYLPVTLQILQKYDDIENQRLNTTESINIMSDTKGMIEKINKSFKNLLSSLYQSEIVDTGAELKVFEQMLNQDGFNQNDFKIK